MNEYEENREHKI